MKFWYFSFSCALYSILKGNIYFKNFQSTFHASPRLLPRTGLKSNLIVYDLPFSLRAYFAFPSHHCCSYFISFCSPSSVLI